MSTPILPPKTKPRRKSGDGHKPDCNCGFCKGARNRATQALALTTGGGDSLPSEAESEVINADDIIVVQGRTRRDHVASWAMMRAQGMKNPDIAAKLGLTLGYLNSLVSKATREGWLRFDNPADRLQYELAPLIVDNVRSALEEGSEKMTIEAAKGIGLFKSYQAVKVENVNPSMVLAIKFETPEDYDPQPGIGSAILGTPRLPDLPGEVVSEED